MPNNDELRTMCGEPVAWAFELAAYMHPITREYSGWRPTISERKPCVPEGSIRNLRPLFAGAPETSPASDPERRK